ncbi:MAG TPA: class I SAM-dependent methyltransferase [Phototrophicaceae bacterium]|jgi:ubiquinone/menaquinone biosynthesis C-methylase UbiE|nr:class I SAM-dependent methyltransferase [Phototrophicaceae bacterium]
MREEDLLIYYNRGREQDRLNRDHSQLEQFRTREIILRYLPPAPAVVMDIGGGAGIYALWLAKLGYSVHLVDLIPLHVEQAQAASDAQSDYPLTSVRIGNALALDFADDSADAVLLPGPLYHLPEKTERVQALREAYRILKPSGLVFAAAISRFASFMDGLMRGYLADEYFAELVKNALVDGQHRNPTNAPGYFTSAYFHYPTDLQTELTEAGFQAEAVVAVEGPASFMPNFDQMWNDETLRERLLQFIRTLESEPTMLGTTGHLMGVGRKRS